MEARSGTEDGVRFSSSCNGGLPWADHDDQHPHDAVGNGPKGRGFGYEVRIAGSADNS